MTTAAILAIMCTLVPPGDGERDRYELIAQAIAETAAADARDERTGWAADELAAMLIATARHESDFRRVVHSGVVKGDRGRSTCLMQINRGARRVGRQHHWSTLAGVDPAATRRCIETGADHYERHEQVCGRSFGCALARYQGHKSSKNKQTQRRLGTFWRVLGMLRQSTPSGGGLPPGHHCRSAVSMRLCERHVPSLSCVERLPHSGQRGLRSCFLTNPGGLDLG